MSSLTDHAQKYATKMHAEVKQVRKYSGEPYIVHPASVVDILSKLPEIKENVKFYDEMIASAWLHDVIEDTRATHTDIIKQFGKMVSTYVFYLTDISPINQDCNKLVKKQGNRDVKHFLYRQFFNDAPIECKYIKLADALDNLSSIKIQDPNFFRVFRHEKLLMLAECYGSSYDYCGLLPKVKEILE